jgi:hypothetical protein
MKGQLQLNCARCQGEGVRAAEMKSFTHEGRALRCLEFVSNCITCGHRWEDPLYEGENSRLVEQACKSGVRQRPVSRDNISPTALAK